MRTRDVHMGTSVGARELAKYGDCIRVNFQHSGLAFLTSFTICILKVRKIIKRQMKV